MSVLFSLKRKLLALLTMALSVVAAQAAAQTAAYPARVVTLVSPFAPGSSLDRVARLLAQKLGESWGQIAVVENRPGASGVIGLTSVARAPADGYTLAMIIVSNATTMALQGNKVTLDLVRDFTPVTQVVSQPYVIVVNPSLPVRSVRELVALAKAKPGAITYGSSGVGSVLHLAGELLASQAKVQMTHVPYKGAALALSDVAGGHIMMLFAARQTVQQLAAAGRVRVLAITSTARLPAAPELPTVQESGMVGPYEVNGWYGVGGPAGMPGALVERLNADINRVLKRPDVSELMNREGTIPTGGTPAQFGALLRSEVERWRRIIQQAGITT